jgi:hypothetical protein
MHLFLLLEMVIRGNARLLSYRGTSSLPSLVLWAVCLLAFLWPSLLSSG